MHTIALGVTITDAAVDEKVTTIFCSPVPRDPRCPDCGRHGRYRDTTTRPLTDLPVAGYPLNYEEPDNSAPVNAGSSELATINQMVDIIEDIAGITVKRNSKLDAPVGVRGRNSDNMMVQEIYGREPSTRLADGLERTYRSIESRLSQRSGRVAL